MTHSHITTGRSYQQLGLDERGVIELMHKQRKSCREIAFTLQRSPSTISRELQRGCVDQMDSNRHIHPVYFADAAQILHENQRLHSRPDSLLTVCNYFFHDLIKALKQRPRVHSIDSFVHAYRMKYPKLRCPSTPTVYRYIDQGLLPLTNLDLPVKLRRRIKRPGLRHSRINKRLLIYRTVA